MISITDLIKTVSNSGIIDVKTIKNIALVVDISGSTNTRFVQSKTVLDKELEILMEYVLKEPQNNYYLYSFASQTTNHGKLDIMIEESFVMLPNFVSNGGTETASAFRMVNDTGIDFTNLILLTDGQTNSDIQDVRYYVDLLKRRKIDINVIAVSTSSTNLEYITTNEENKIAGMDLVNMLNNSVSTLEIYNLHHKDVPFKGIINSHLDKNHIMFMDIKINGYLIEFINNLIDIIDKQPIDWGSDINIKKFFCEFGKLFSYILPTFNPEHYLLIRFIHKLTNIEQMNFTKERILKIMEYGFNCSRQSKPIILTNFDERVKQSVVKHKEFADAITELKTFGTGLNSDKKISIPTFNKPICIIDEKNHKLVGNLGPYNNSKDINNLIYFGIDANPQAVRIGMREFCSSQGFRDSRSSPSVIFYILNQMSIMYLTGIDFNNEQMKELRKLAIAQTSLEVVISKGVYDGIGCYGRWKKGELVKIHFTQNETHTSLYNDNLINSLNFNEILWWALMMTFLGLFEEQKKYFINVLILLNIEPNVNSFLEWFRNTFSHCVTGHYEILKYNNLQKSIFTLDDFDIHENVYELQDHGDCRTKTWYSQTEINTYINHNGCVWCRHIPTNQEFIQIDLNGNNYDELINNTKKININYEILNDIYANNPNLSLNVNTRNEKKLCFYLFGITGSGKTTFADKINNYILNKNGLCYIMSYDKHAKLGQNNKQVIKSIKNEFNTFESSDNPLKVLVIDMCNENGSTNNVFECNISSYKKINVYPNLNRNDYLNYEAWCLNNVLSRPLHDRNSKYWLNPVSAGYKKCVEIHNKKSSGIAKLLNIRNISNFIPDDDMNIFLQTLKPKVDLYNQYLTTINNDELINNLFNNNI